MVDRPASNSQGWCEGTSVAKAFRYDSWISLSLCISGVSGGPLSLDIHIKRIQMRLCMVTASQAFSSLSGVLWGVEVLAYIFLFSPGFKLL